MLDVLREWFLANRPIILFIYGQVFFVMGVAILLQSRRYSRLDLARSLPWLAAFGILHGFNEWGDLFIPIQSQFVSEPIIHFMYAVQTLLLAVSFACLLKFGVELLRPLPERWRWLRFVPAVILSLWVLGGFWIRLQLLPDLETWRHISNALARYALGFPGALLSAFALRRHARLRIQPLGLPRIYNTLRLAGLALAAYAVLGGLIASRAPIFPANVLNSEWVVTYLVFPPPLLRSIAGLVLAVSIIRALEVFEVETDQLIDQMEQAQVIAIERERIGRDLHDGAIQTVYSAGLLAVALRKKAAGPLADGLDRLVFTLNQAIADLRGFMSELRSDNANADLAVAITSIVEATRQASGVQIDWQPQPLGPLPPDRMTHLIAFMREALSNAVRHAQARSIEVRAEVIDRNLKLSVQDDGRGFAPDVPHGFGLRNMRDRARLLGGEATFDSTPGKGTTVSVNVSVEREA